MENIKLKIIELLKDKNANNYVSGEDIAYFLSVSKRTVFSHINSINDVSYDYGFHIVSKKGLGYKLCIDDEELFSDWYSSSSIFIDDNEVGIRQKSIFYKLLVNDDYINIYDIADEFSISASLARKDIKALDPLIEKYGLCLKHSYSHGYLIVGEENNIRKAISKEISIVNPDYLNLYSGRHNTETLNQLAFSIEKNLNDFDIAISDKQVDSLVFHILIALNRIETNNPISCEANYNKDTVEYRVSELINKDISKIFDITLSDDEIYYFSKHIKSSNPIYHEYDGNIEENDEVIIFYNIFLRGIYDYSNINFFDDDNLRASLFKHISLFIYRLKNNVQIEKSSLTMMKDEFPYALELAVHGLKGISRKYKEYITESESLYFAIHLALSLETNKRIKKYNIAVLMDDSETLFRLISHRINTALKEKINTIQLLRYKDIAKLKRLDNADLIINSTGNKLWFDIPTISIKDYLSDNDIVSIKQTFEVLDSRDELEDFICKEMYFVMECDTKEEVLRNAIHAIHNINGIDEEKLYQSVINREKYCSTAFSNKIAIPHPLDPNEFPNFISICRLRKPVLWDDKHVQLIFLFSLNGSEAATKSFLDKLSKIILDDKKSILLNKATCYEEFMNEFLQPK